MLPLQARTVELWRERNPGLDTSPMEVVALVKRVRVLLDRAVEDLYDGAALTSAEVELLVPLRHADEPVTAARLAARLGMSRAGISKTLAKLEKRGLITRAANPADRRAALIRMTPEGRRSSTTCSRVSWRPTASCSRAWARIAGAWSTPSPASRRPWRRSWRSDAVVLVEGWCSAYR
ncbi:MarR family winged helix-turn-helix transcriptional regulator [Saccharopolyspora spinosporotrichia]